VCLTADRQQYTDRAVACFLAQTYSEKRLLIWDTGKIPYRPTSNDFAKGLIVRGEAATIGALRNQAAGYLRESTDIIAHWDSDDWSAPERLSDQIKALDGREVVGYNEMLFWNSQTQKAYLYTNTLRGYCIGTSLCYWRKTWEKTPFDETSAGEDDRWVKLHHCWSRPAMATYYVHADWISEDTKTLFEPVIEGTPIPPNLHQAIPLMVAEVHGGNTHLCDPQQHVDDPTQAQFTRAPEWDERLKGLMKL